MSRAPAVLLAAGLAVVSLAGPATAATDAATPSDAATATAAPETELLGLPPATADVAVAPVVDLVASSAPLAAPANPLIASTGSTDGAVTTDASKEKQAFTLAGDVFFEPTSAELTARAEDGLTSIAERLTELSPTSVTVVGHTDDVDTDAYNQDLSERRAEAVRAFLLERSSDLPVTAEGRGESHPVASNDSDEGRALNRRVEVTAEAG
ncbi:OmpA family protein [Georgenia subflava]|uniref:OmpA family protein n=1 Tax=Georgenia subflava TaxID=1622177 RepID=A0A6N7EKU0_9MICO|nr:OmpA family protein [Georgenia subflava]MPV37165.1 OmpA family protein [Georgenia subflava]